MALSSTPRASAHPAQVDSAVGRRFHCQLLKTPRPHVWPQDAHARVAPPPPPAPPRPPLLFP
jgi:hypothetical protein